MDNSHNIQIKVPDASVANKPVEFAVLEGGKKLGTLLVSKGKIGWRPKNKKKGKNPPASKDWRSFAEWITTN